MEILAGVVVLLFLTWILARSIGWIDNVKNIRNGRSKAIGWIVLLLAVAAINSMLG